MPISTQFRIKAVLMDAMFSGLVTAPAAAQESSQTSLDCSPIPAMQVPATPEPRLGGWSGDPGGGNLPPLNGPGSAFCQAQPNSRPDQCWSRPSGISTFFGVPGPNSGLASLQSFFSQASPALANAVRDALRRHSNGIFTGYPGPGPANELLALEIRVICDAQSGLTPASEAPSWALGYQEFDANYVPALLAACWAAMHRIEEEAGIAPPSVETRVREFLNGYWATTAANLGSDRYTGLVQGIVSVVFYLQNGTIAPPVNSLANKIAAISALRDCEQWCVNSDAAACATP